MKRIQLTRTILEEIISWELSFCYKMMWAEADSTLLSDQVKYRWPREMASEKAMAPHSSTLAWKIPQTEEPGRLQSMRSLRVGHNWATSRSLFSFMHWRRKWQPIQCSCLENPRVGGAWWTSMGSHRVRHYWSNLAAAAAERWSKKINTSVT